MGIWQAVDNDTSLPLYQISQTPRGVANVHWTPDGQHLTAELLTSEQTMMGYRRVPLVLSPGGESAWSPLFLGNNDYFVDYGWSPDGSRMVLVGDGELQVVDASGDLIHSFPPPTDDSTFGGPQFVPDGDSVLVTIWSTEDNGTTKELWVYALGDGTSRLLLDNPACSAPASWSPQGDAMACLGEDYESTRFPGGGATLWLQALDGTSPVSAELASLPGTEGSLQPPQWVAGGQAVVATVLFQPGVWLVDRDGNVTSLSAADASLQSVALGSDSIGKAAVNPTGAFVLFDPGPGGNTVLNVATGEKIPIAMPLLEIDFARWAPQAPHFLAWRPYYQGDAEGVPLQLVDARTGEVQTLDSSGSWPSWSPDGRRIAYWKKAEDGNLALWLLELGGEPLRLTSPTPEELGRLTYYNLTPQWSPDGRALAFVSLREDTSQAYVLELE
jgi:Tol biopolymer transport system component